MDEDGDEDEPPDDVKPALTPEQRRANAAQRRERERFGWDDNRTALPDLYGPISDTIDNIKDGKSLLEFGDTALGLAADLVPGGRQLKRSRQGVETILRGGRYKGYGEDSRLLYPVDATWQQVLQASIFGNNALAATRDFYAGGDSGLSKNQTALYESLVSGGADRMETYHAIQDWRRIGNDKDGELDSYERGRMQRDVLRALDMDDEQKLALYTGLSGADTRGEKFQTLMAAGLTWAQVMDAYDQYAALNAGEGMAAGKKAAALARWADTQGFTKAQAAAVKNQLKFFSIVPAEATRYQHMTDAGLDAGKAYELTQAFDALAPLPGANSVSNMQRYRAIEKAALTEREKIAAIGAVMGDTAAYQKLAAATEAGVRLGQCLDLLDAGAFSGGAKDIPLYRAVVDAANRPEDQLAALSALMTDAEFNKVRTGDDFGVTPELYVRAREIMAGMLEGAGRSGNGEDVKAAVKKIPGLTITQKAALWQILSPATTATNNPFNTVTGKKVQKALDDWKKDEPQGLSLPRLTG